MVTIPEIARRLTEPQIRERLVQDLDTALQIDLQAREWGEAHHIEQSA